MIVMKQGPAMSVTFHRCRHCRGFYETELSKCPYCEYETPVLDAAGKARVYPDRETVRAIQLAEYDQLPAEAHEDSMGPPRDRPERKCACIHCGPGGRVFEAIEMRWMANEEMWACPCTTCGGRGFQFDIHPIEREWQCAECHHWYTPEKFTSKYAKCPKCGSTYANGWYDDADEDGEPVTDEDFEEDFDEEFDEDLDDDMGEETDDEEADIPAALLPKADIPWENDVKPFDPAASDDDDERACQREKLPDDIDFPHHFDRDEADGRKGRPGVEEDDIPY